MMKEKYETEGRGIRLIELEDSFQMCTNPELYEYLIKIAKQPKKRVLTDVLLETLSIIAYKQPITKAEIEKATRTGDYAKAGQLQYGKLAYPATMQ